MAVRPKMKSKSQSDLITSRALAEQSEINRIDNLRQDSGGLVHDTLAVLDWMAREIQAGCNSYVIKPQIQKDRLIEMPALGKVAGGDEEIMRRGE